MSGVKVGPHGRFAASEHVRSRQFDDERVMLDLQGGAYFALDAIGARMWDSLTAGQTPAEVAAHLVSEYEASQEQILEDCVLLAAELVNRGLLVRRSP